MAELHGEEETNDKRGVVCVTGAGGFVASWLIKLLLSKGYVVHGTVRNPGAEKNAHLYKLDKADQNLKLFQAELLDYKTLLPAIAGCVGVFHVASPLPLNQSRGLQLQDPENELIEPAVTGTVNVLTACLAAKVKRVIYVSSGTAVFMNPNWPKDQVKDESCWSDTEFLRDRKIWYCLSKTLAESKAKEFGEEKGIDVVRVCPVLVFGPMLQPTLNASSGVLLDLLKVGLESTENKLQKLVDVRDVANGLLLAYEKAEAEGRYICASHMIKTRDLAHKLKTLYPNYNYPQSYVELEEEPPMSSAKLQNLGWKYRSLETTLIDSVECYREAGILN